MARRGDGIYLRGKTWWLDFTHQGTRHVVRIGKGINRTVAREIAQVKRASILKAEVGIGGPKRKDPLFDDAVKEFVVWAKTNRKARTAFDYEGILERLKAATFGGRSLGQIDELSIERHKRRRVEAGAPVAVNRELAVLKSLFNRCRDDLRIYEGPTPRIKLLKETGGRLRFLDLTEETELLKAAGEPLRTIILVGIHTGLRIKSEVLTLRVADVDLTRSLLTVLAAYAKNGRSRTVPLNSTIRAALAKHLEGRSDGLVFARRDGKPYRSIRRGFRLACEAAGLKDVSPHVLRHTFASRLAMAGVDPRTIQELGGWRSLAMVERYTHLSPTHKASAVERIASAEFPNAIPNVVAVRGGRRAASRLQ
jgi:integrase